MELRRIAAVKLTVSDERCDDLNYNGVRNIAHKYLQNRPTGSGGVTQHLALKSRTLNGNGECSPSAVSRTDREFTDNPRRSRRGG